MNNTTTDTTRAGDRSLHLQCACTFLVAVGKHACSCTLGIVGWRVFATTAAIWVNSTQNPEQGRCLFLGCSPAAFRRRTDTSGGERLI